MQGYSPHEAFATLPRSLRGAHEETLMAAQIAPAEVEEEPVWSLDREQVHVGSLVTRPSAPPVFVNGEEGLGMRLCNACSYSRLIC